MADKTSKTRSKRLSKGKRTHVRRLKQASRKTGASHSELIPAQSKADKSYVPNR